MSLTSYAPNFEDVLLWRALKHVSNGTYLDVGAGHPLTGSVTRWLYQQGWSGINLEPARALFRQLQQDRPADINLPIAAGASSGSAPFYEISDSNLSTFDTTLAQQYRATGREVLVRDTELQTLNHICQQYMKAPLHLLHLSRQAGAALAGFDLSHWQPWLILVPADEVDAQQRLRDAGYILAYQDGWKLYFVSPQQAALAVSLTLPPNLTDGFVLCEDHPRSFPLSGWRERCASAEADNLATREWANHAIEQQKQRGNTLEAELERVRLVNSEQATALERDRAHYLEQRTQLEQRLATEHARAQHCEHLQTRAEHAEATLSGVYSSLSWRLTRPLRSANLLAHRGLGFLRRLPGRLRHAIFSRIKRILAGSLGYINRHPRLSFFLRRNVSRIPFLLPLARAVHLRMKLSQANTAQAITSQAPTDATAVPDLSQLPDAAHRILDDLRRSAIHS